MHFFTNIFFTYTSGFIGFNVINRLFWFPRLTDEFVFFVSFLGSLGAIAMYYELKNKLGYQISYEL
jgi:hypothetical protein